MNQPTPEEVRQHVTEIEIDATPEQVFRALTEAEEIVRWFAPEAKVEPGPDGNMVGGSYYISWGPGMEGRSTISIWEPYERFAGFEERSQPYGCEGDTPVETGTPRRIAVEYQIEALGGGKTRLRLVHSGFGRGAGWDDEFESTQRGWPVLLRNLKHALERHPGVDSTTVSVTAPCPITPEEVWRRLAARGRLENLKPGDRYSVRLSSGAVLEGTVSAYNPPEMFGGVGENLNDALVTWYCGSDGKGTTVVNVTFTLWGPARDRSNQLHTEWAEQLKAATAA